MAIKKASLNNTIIALCIFLSLQPWFTWFDTKIMNYLLGIIMFFASYKYLSYAFSKQNSNIILFFIACMTYFFIGGTKYSGFSLFPLLPLLFLLLPDYKKLSSFELFVKIYAYVVFIGIFTYLIRFLVDLPSFKINALNTLKGVKYDVYIFDVSMPQFLFPRYMSVFDEPGVVGTISALLISYKKITLKNFTEFAILLSGLLSFSLAFYIILFLNVAYNFKYVYSKIFFLFLGLFLIVGEAGVFDTYLFSRLQIVDGKLSGDNRTGKVFERNYEYFVNKGGEDLIFGRGAMADKYDDPDNSGSSFKFLVYRHGIVGVTLFAIFFIFMNLSKVRSPRGYFFLLVFILLAYQRINIFMLYNIAIFIGGTLYIARAELENKKNRVVNYQLAT